MSRILLQVLKEMRSHGCVVLVALLVIRFQKCGAFRQSQESMWNCTQKNQPLDCIKVRSIQWLDRMRTRDIPLIGSTVELIHDPSVKLLSRMPKSMNHFNGSQLDSILGNAIWNFLESRRVRVSLPSISSLIVEGRKNKKGIGPYLLMALMMGASMLTMKLAGLAALAGKALATSLAALVLSAVAALIKKPMGGNEKNYEVIKVPSNTHRRSTTRIYPQFTVHPDPEWEPPKKFESYKTIL